MRCHDSCLFCRPFKPTLLRTALRSAAAAEGPFEAMLLGCIDPRLVEPMHDYMTARGLRNRYSQCILAGGSIGVMSQKFANWHQTFWDNLATSIRLHRISRLIAMDHRDCGAARIAFGADRLADPEEETSLHAAVLAAFRATVIDRHPDLVVETGLMALDGSVQVFS